jgi:hypothetical protein
MNLLRAVFDVCYILFMESAPRDIPMRRHAYRTYVVRTGRRMVIMGMQDPHARVLGPERVLDPTDQVDASVDLGSLATGQAGVGLTVAD